MILSFEELNRYTQEERKQVARLVLRRIPTRFEIRDAAGAAATPPCGGSDRSYSSWSSGVTCRRATQSRRSGQPDRVLERTPRAAAVRLRRVVSAASSISSSQSSTMRSRRPSPRTFSRVQTSASSCSRRASPAVPLPAPRNPPLGPDRARASSVGFGPSSCPETMHLFFSRALK